MARLSRNWRLSTDCNGNSGCGLCNLCVQWCGRPCANRIGTQRKDALNDALIYLTASKRALPVLTDNHADFDLLQQLEPQGRFYVI